MNSILAIGIVIFGGFILGQQMHKLRLPKIVGYLIAGILFNPQICHFVPKDISSDTNIIENMAIAFIAFAIGGTIEFKKIKKLGKGIMFITIFEAEITFLVIAAGIITALPFIVNIPQANWFTFFVPAGLLLGCLGSPTDPSGALAVVHEYKANGQVSSTVLSVAAFDDVLGIINYSVAIVIAQAVITHQAFSIDKIVLTPFLIIIGSVVLGVALGLVFNYLTKQISKQREGSFFVLIISFISLCWGLATLIHVEEILAIMIMGIVVANYNLAPKKVFAMMERYSEELIFLIFFTLSGMHLDLHYNPLVMILLVLFIVFRLIGKFTGTYLGAWAAKSPPEVKKYTAQGLIPFGGIVIGLALMVQQNPAFSEISSGIVSVIIGATIINEFIGPIIFKNSLKHAGEIKE